MRHLATALSMFSALVLSGCATENSPTDRIDHFNDGYSETVVVANGIESTLYADTDGRVLATLSYATGAKIRFA